MKYTEIKADLFKISKEYTLVQCISSDCKMGAGIAIEFMNRNPYMRTILKRHNPKIGDAILYSYNDEHNVINLITKKHYYDKPTRTQFNDTIVHMKQLVIEHNIKKLGLPLLGSGLDRLSWNESSKWIQEVFKDTDVEILVCKL